MDRRIMVLLFLVAVVAAGISYMQGMAESPQGDYTKILVLDITVADGRVSAPSAEIRYGYPPETGLRAGTFTGTLLSDDGRVVRTFAIWDPRVQFGDAETDDGQGGIHGFKATRDSASLHLVLPYTGEEARFRLTDTATGRRLAEADITDAAEAFAKTYPQDPAIVAARDEGRIPLLRNPQLRMIGTGLVIFLALVVVSVLMTRRERK